MNEPGVLERDAEAAGECGQEALVGVGEGVLAIDVLERDNPGRLAARDERDEEHRLGRIPRENRRVAEAGRRAGNVLVHHERLACLHHVLAEDQLDRFVRIALRARVRCRADAKGCGRRKQRAPADHGFPPG